MGRGHRGAVKRELGNGKPAQKSPLEAARVHRSRYGKLLSFYLKAIGADRIAADVPSARLRRSKESELTVEALSKYLEVPYATAVSYTKGARLPPYATHSKILALLARVEHQRVMEGQPHGYPCSFEVWRLAYWGISEADAREGYEFRDHRLDYAVFEFAWSAAAKGSLRKPAFTDDESDFVHSWPNFVHGFRHGWIRRDQIGRVGIDASGLGNMRVAVMRPSNTLADQPKCIVLYNGVPRYALQPQYAPRVKGGRKSHLLSDQSAWAGNVPEFLNWNPERTYQGETVLLSDVEVLWVEAD